MKGLNVHNVCLRVDRMQRELDEVKKDLVELGVKTLKDKPKAKE